jgi:hypothetical protein
MLKLFKVNLYGTLVSSNLFQNLLKLMIVSFVILVKGIYKGCILIQLQVMAMEMGYFKLSLLL